MVLALGLAVLALGQTTYDARTGKTYDARGREFRPVDESLFQAAQEGDAARVRALLAKGADPTRRYTNDWPILTWVGGKPPAMLAVVKLLVAHGARVNDRQADQGYTALTHAFQAGEGEDTTPVVLYLLSAGANPNAPLNDGTTALHMAVGDGMVAAARALLARGARLDARTNDRDVVKPTTLGLDPAARRDAERDADLNAHRAEPGFRLSGLQPVHFLATHWDPAVADLLLKAGASLKATDDNGWTPLHYAARGGNPATVVGLIARGADPNAASKGGYRPLHLALRAGNGFPDAAMVRALIAHGADPKLRNRADQTPLDLLRADARWLIGNPSHDPARAFPARFLPQYQAMVDAAAKALDPSAAPVVLALPRPDPKGQRYAPLELMNGTAERTVRVENGEAILELRLPPLKDGNATFTVREVALEEYDTLTPLPMVVKRRKGVPNVLAFRFPAGAARGGEVNLAADQQGPGNTSGSMGQTSSAGETDNTHPQPGFAFLDGGVSISHDVPDRTMEFEIVSARRAGRALPDLAGKRLRVPSGEEVPIPGLRVDPSVGRSPTSETVVEFRFRYLPNVRWRKGSIPL